MLLLNKANIVFFLKNTPNLYFNISKEKSIQIENYLSFLSLQINCSVNCIYICEHVHMLIYIYEFLTKDTIKCVHDTLWF